MPFPVLLVIIVGTVLESLTEWLVPAAGPVITPLIAGVIAWLSFVTYPGATLHSWGILLQLAALNTLAQVLPVLIRMRTPGPK